MIEWLAQNWDTLLMLGSAGAAGGSAWLVFGPTKGQRQEAAEERKQDRLARDEQLSQKRLEQEEAKRKRREQERLRREESERLARQQIAEQILEGDPRVRRVAISRAGSSVNDQRRHSEYDAVARDIAEQLEPWDLTVLRIASEANDHLDALELRTSAKVEEVEHPTDDQAIEPIRSLDEITRVPPEELAQDDDIFWANVANNDFSVLRYYDRTTIRRRLVVLIDTSGSMRENMRDGAQRIQWAAGVGVKLMLRAEEGGAEFIVRFFDALPTRPYVVKTPSEATDMLNEFLILRDSNGGTEIQKALAAAKGDIENGDTGINATDVLLITDGESSLNEQWVRENFGTNADIGLHLALIGLRNEFLISIADSYEIYS